MRDNLPKRINTIIERGIINLDSSANIGTHWTAYVKKNKSVFYYDSYGNLKPPSEIVDYFNSAGKVKIHYNYDTHQRFHSSNCGQLSLNFLYNSI